METYRLSFEVTTDADPDVLKAILIELGVDLEQQVESYGYALLGFNPRNDVDVLDVIEGEE